MICSDFLAKFHFLENESRDFQCLSDRGSKVTFAGRGQRCCSIWLRVKDQNCAAEGVLYLQWSYKRFCTYYPTGRAIRNVDSDKSSYKSVAGRCVDSGCSGSFSLKLEGTQLSGTTSGFCISIICHKDKLKSCQFVFGELHVPGEAHSVGRL